MTPAELLCLALWALGAWEYGVREWVMGRGIVVAVMVGIIWPVAAGANAARTALDAWEMR